MYLFIKRIHAILTVTYDIMNTEAKFDFNAFALLMDQQDGHFYVQVASSLTQQVERIPIKFLAPSDMTTYSSDHNHHKERTFTNNMRDQHKPTSHLGNLFGWLVDYSPNQIITFLIMVSILLVSILFLLKVKSPTQQAAEQIALNASAAAAAVIAANTYRTPGSGVKETNTFNPYRYFTSNPDVQAYETSPSRSLFNKSGNLSFADRSPTNLSFRNQSYKTEPGDPRIATYITTSPRARLNTTDRDGVRLYSVNPSDGPSFTDSNYEYTRRGANQQYDSSDNEDSRQFARRVPPRQN